LLFLAGLQNNGCSTEFRLLVVITAPGHTGERERECFWSGAVSKTHLLLSVYFETCFQEKVLMEQREIFGDSDCPPTYRDIQEMKYLEMVIKEALRLYPSIPVFGRKLQKDVDVGE
jgi:hypothetical protein